MSKYVFWTFFDAQKILLNMSLNVMKISKDVFCLLLDVLNDVSEDVFCMCWMS